jgi:hypothetical protein
MPKRNTPDDLWMNTEIEKNGCLTWLGPKDKDGYGKIGFKSKWWRTHRLAYHLANKGDDPTFVCHHCDNPSCINPKHLFPGDPLINNRDRKNKGRNNNVRNEKHAMAKWSDAEIAEMRRMRSEGGSLKEIAYKFGVSISHACGVTKNRTRIV